MKRDWTTAQAQAEKASRPTPTLRKLLVALLALAAILPATANGALAPAPAWSITARSMPTRFLPETTGSEAKPPGYLLIATNIGAAATSGGFEISDTLPAGLAFALSKGAYGSYGTSGTELTCGVSGQTVTCDGLEPKLQPGEAISMTIPVKVLPGAASSVVDEASAGGGGAPFAITTTETAIQPEPPPFAILPGSSGLSTTITGADGTEVTQAGSHPYQLSAGIGLPTTTSAGGELLAIGGGVRDLTVDLPRGLIVSSLTGQRCTEAQLESSSTDPPGCPDSSQVGTLTVALLLGGGNPNVSILPLYNMVPVAGTPVEFGVEVTEGIYIHMLSQLRSESDYGLSARINDISAKAALVGAEVTLWGNPSDQSHDFVRGRCLIVLGGACPVDRTDAAFLSLPNACGRPIAMGARADSWIEPGVFSERRLEGPTLDGCNRLDFEPTISSRPTTRSSDSPSGLDLELRLPQNDRYAGLAEASLRDATLTLPEGLTANPAGADGLGACAPTQIGLLTPVGEDPVQFSGEAASCPDAAKVGTAEVETPLLDYPLAGALYLAEPRQNPFGSLFAIYLAVDDPQSGIVIKLAGRITADPVSGRLTARFAENPELPIAAFRQHFFGGPRALFKTPLGCRTYDVHADLTPWSSPEGADVTSSDSFSIGPAAGCPASEADAPNSPWFSAGSVAPRAGAYSPFVLRLTRADGSQRLTTLDLTLPAGLAGRLAGVPDCSDAQIVAASCPATTEVGTVDIAAGAGIMPLHLGGRIYMAGPYKGAPLSLAILTPAIAGPFDLGTVLVRVALYVDSRSTQIHAISDPLPTILQGVPLDIRSLSLRLDRPDLTLNPTSCERMSIPARTVSAQGRIAVLSDRFQVGECSRLGFKPQVAVRLLGPTHRGAHPSFRTTLTARRGDANIRRVAVTLPGTELLDSRHIDAICTAEEFAAERCPAGSIYGYAKGWTPLLDWPLEGPVYLRSSRHKLPDLAASLEGQVQLDLIGRIDSVDGRLRNTFSALPDVPLSKVVVTLKGGRKGLIANTGRLCARKPRASASFYAHNLKTREIDPVVKTDCGKKGRR
jgi:hypothetical protein